MARPSLFLLALLACVAGAAALAPLAAAAPPTPLLTGTNPPSPNLVTNPRVRGSSTGIITAAFPAARLSADAAERKILIFLGTGCVGDPAAIGTPAELEGTGIPITVESLSFNYISALQTDFEDVSDPGGHSDCSKAISYEHVTELPPVEEPPPGDPGNPGGPGPGGVAPPDPPLAGGPAPAPPSLRTVPGGFANNNTPLVTGSAPGAASVKIFADPACAGGAIARVSAAQLGSGFKVRVADNDVITFTGISVGPGGTASRCSDPVYYVEDSITPRTRITMAPGAKTRKRVAVFRFKDVNGNAPGTKFLCRVDKRKWKRCTSPLRIKKLRPRKYMVRVKAVDAAGNAERKPVSRRFKVVRPG